MSLKTYKILIVEDEQIPANYIKKILQEYGHDVLGIADSKEKALSYLKEKKFPELILMDIKIKGTADGITTAIEFQKHTNVAILYLSAYSNEAFLDRAKDTHPIGYLVKPVQPQTLTSTIEIGMANFTQSFLTQNVNLSESIVFNPNEQTISDGKNQINLSNHESKILSVLIKNRNKLVSYTILEYSAWLHEPAGEGSLRTTIWRLRNKLPSSVEIENLYRSGYKISF